MSSVSIPYRSDVLRMRHMHLELEYYMDGVTTEMDVWVSVQRSTKYWNPVLSTLEGVGM